MALVLYIYGFLGLRKHKKGKPVEGQKHIFAISFMIFFIFLVFGVFQNVGNDMCMQEVTCMCRK